MRRVEFFAWLGDHPAAIKLAITGLALVLVTVARTVAVRMFEGSGLPPERRNRFLVQTRNLAILVFLGSTVVLWAEQLQTVAFSLAAIAAALVVATKELILCLSGTLLRVSAKTFRLGDRIEIQGIRGDVIDIGPMTTTLLEVGPDLSIHKLTGRTVVLPNSLFLSTPVYNETFTERYVLHTTNIEVPLDSDWSAIERRLLKAAHAECDDFLDEARSNMERVGNKHGLAPPDVTPKVWLSTRGTEKLELTLRFPSPIRGRGRTEQAILRRYLGASPSEAQAER